MGEPSPHSGQPTYTVLVRDLNNVGVATIYNVPVERVLYFIGLMLEWDTGIKLPCTCPRDPVAAEWDEAATVALAPHIVPNG